MINRKKFGIQILVILVVFSLGTELILGLTVGYGTKVQGRFKEGLNMEGDINYNFTNVVVLGEEWETNFCNLSSIYIRFFDYNDVLFERTYLTSNLTVTVTPFGDPSPYITLYNITRISKFSSATFLDENTSIKLATIPENQITGSMNTSFFDDYLTFRSVIVETDNETIEVLRRGWFYIYGNEGNKVQFNISVTSNCSISTRTLNMDFNKGIISLNGDIQANDFGGSIRSNGKLYFSSNLQMSGKMKIKILQNPDTYYNHDIHQYDWKLEIEGENVDVEGFGLPFWGLGLIFSVVPLVIVFAYHINKKILKKKKKNE